ncbi:MAG: glycosyltransferase family 9 protein [Candidatus Tectomicrobia bacterium]|uniref:Glycosyltransferase family 9 protein n=1 Tax=Tectimicrobiota bacterium TaxID=2528274 RepID=A0A932I028_UNCTE|nr:glycosyltransferase family 9 protein [Candidatus Tectomicrobia bacterium]
MSRRVLIIRLGAVGDVVHALPLASAIRDAWPDARIAWAAEPSPSRLLQGNPDLDEVLTVDTRAWRRKLPAGGFAVMRRDLGAIRRLEADVAIDAQGLLKSGFLAWASGAGTRVGFEHRACREGMNVLFTNRQALLPTHPHHVVEKNLRLLEPLGIPIPPPEARRFPLHERPEERETAEAFLRREGLLGRRPLLVMHPGAGWPTKRWAPERFAALGDAWREESGGGVLLTWGPSEEASVREVASAMRTGAAVAPETGIREMTALIRRGDCFAGGDTGPTHLAAALGLPCLAVMGPTDPVRNGPWGPGHKVLHRRLACSDCYGRSCPDIECLDRIGAEEAARGLLALWKTHEKYR